MNVKTYVIAFLMLVIGALLGFFVHNQIFVHAYGSAADRQIGDFRRSASLVSLIDPGKHDGNEALVKRLVESAQVDTIATVSMFSQVTRADLKESALLLMRKLGDDKFISGDKGIYAGTATVARDCIIKQSEEKSPNYQECATRISSFAGKSNRMGLASSY